MAGPYRSIMTRRQRCDQLADRQPPPPHPLQETPSEKCRCDSPSGSTHRPTGARAKTCDNREDGDRRKVVAHLYRCGNPDDQEHGAGQGPAEDRQGQPVGQPDAPQLPSAPRGKDHRRDADVHIQVTGYPQQPRDNPTPGGVRRSSRCFRRDPRQLARRQLLLPVSDNYFCRRRVGEGAPLATAAELGNCRWPVAGRG